MLKRRLKKLKQSEFDGNSFAVLGDGRAVGASCNVADRLLGDNRIALLDALDLNSLVAFPHFIFVHLLRQSWWHLQQP